MNLPIQNGLRMPKISLGLVLSLVLATGCSVIGPTGTNASQTVYQTADENGVVVISVPAPADALKAVFVVRNAPDEETFPVIEDDSPEGADAGTPCDGVEGFCVSFTPPEGTAPNVYLMDVFIDDEEQAEAAATIPFLVGGEVAVDEAATDTEDAADAEATEETEQ